MQAGFADLLVNQAGSCKTGAAMTLSTCCSSRLTSWFSCCDARTASDTGASCCAELRSACAMLAQDLLLLQLDLPELPDRHLAFDAALLLPFCELSPLLLDVEGTAAAGDPKRVRPLFLISSLSSSDLRPSNSAQKH